jgi:hypothetical protein
MEASEHTPSENGTGQSPWAAQEASRDAVGRPEIPVLGALIGGFVLAKVIGRLAGDDD